MNEWEEFCRNCGATVSGYHVYCPLCGKVWDEYVCGENKNIDGRKQPQLRADGEENRHIKIRHKGLGDRRTLP